MDGTRALHLLLQPAAGLRAQSTLQSATEPRLLAVDARARGEERCLGLTTSALGPEPPTAAHCLLWRTTSGPHLSDFLTYSSLL